MNYGFTFNPNLKKIKGTLFYIKSDYSFDFEPIQDISLILVFGHLSVEFDYEEIEGKEELRAKQVWGFHSHLGWIDKKLTQPNASQGGLLLEHQEKYIVPQGVALGVIDDGEWKTYYDKESGWVCFGDFLTNGTDQAVEFADGIIAVLKDKKIKALWMHPIIRKTSD